MAQDVFYSYFITESLNFVNNPCGSYYIDSPLLCTSVHSDWLGTKCVKCVRFLTQPFFGSSGNAPPSGRAIRKVMGRRWRIFELHEFFVKISLTRIFFSCVRTFSGLLAVHELFFSQFSLA